MDLLHKKKEEKLVSKGGEPFRCHVVTSHGLADPQYFLDQILLSEKDGTDGFDPEVIPRPHRKEEITLSRDEVTQVRELWYDKSIASARYHKEASHYAKLRTEILDQWRSYKNAWMKQWREKHTRYEQRFRAKPELIHRRIVWYRTVRVLYADYEKLGLNRENAPLHDLDEMGKILKDYKPSNPFMLELGGRKIVSLIKVRYSKTISYWRKNELKGKFYLRRIPPSRAILHEGIERFLKANPPPTYKNNEQLAHQIKVVNKWRGRMGAEWNRLLAIISTGELDARVLAGSLWGANLMFSHPRVTAVPYTTSSYNSALAYCEDRRLLTRPYLESIVAAGPLRPGRPEDIPPVLVTQTTVTTDQLPISEFNAGFDNGSIWKPLLNLSKNFAIRDADRETERFSRSLFELENLEVGQDELDRIDFNAFRSLAELKDMSRTKSEVKEFLAFILRGEWRKIGGLHSKSTIRAFLKAYLAWKFAGAPTVADYRTVAANTRASLLGCRRSLWLLAQHMNLFQQGSVTIRKGVNDGLRIRFGENPMEGVNLPLERFRTALGYNSVRSWAFGFTPLNAWGQKTPLDYEYGATYVPTSIISESYESKLDPLSEAERPEMAAFVADSGPSYFLDESKTFLFQRWLFTELLKAINPSEVFNLVETIKLPKNAWELYPMSFIVDWFLNTGRVVRSLQSILGSAASHLSPSSAAWLSWTRNLVLVVPHWRITRRVGHSSPNIVPNPFVAPSARDTYPILFKGYTQGTVSTEAQLIGLRAYPTGVKHYIRCPHGVPDFARSLLPRFSLNMNSEKALTFGALLAGQKGVSYIPDLIRQIGFWQNALAQLIYEYTEGR
jgi:hypothetical protein